MTTEERDRPTLPVVDQRMSMFVGSRLNMKAVTAAEAAALTRAPRAVARIAARDHLAIVPSDFDGADAETRRLVFALARRNDLAPGLVMDPFAEEMPERLRLQVSDGELHAEIDAGDGAVRTRLRDMARGRLAEALARRRSFGLPLPPLSAAEETLPRMRRLMDLGPGRSAGRAGAGR
ncbi:MAG: hypothetical protein VYD87_10345 [Pseudomonadota bacterium]|nr:hypothetical protein [Pseudomonadota bacterium]